MRNYIHSFYRRFKLRQVMSLSNLYGLERQRYKPGTAATKVGAFRYVDASTFLSGLKEIFIDEIYKVKKWNSRHPMVVDCGANIGLSSIYFARNYQAEVYAYEADPNIYEALTNNVRTNHYSDKIHTFNKAIWIDNAGVDFDIEGAYSGQIHQHGHERVKGSIRVPSLRLRDLLLQHKRIDFLKIDIEGAENQVVPDCSGVLSKVDYIFIEYHAYATGPQMLGEILNILKAEGFVYHIREAFTSKRPFVQVQELCGMNLQLNIYAINSNLV